MSDNETRSYVVIIEEGPTSWGAYAPDLPGCAAVAATRAEVELLIREAVEFHIEGLRLTNQPAPMPRSEASHIRVAA